MVAVTYAAHYGCPKAFIVLVDELHARIDIPSADEYKQGPLFRAAKGGSDKHLVIVQELIRRGAEINAQEAFGQTPLAVASHKGIVEVVGVLIKAKADPCITDGDQRTALSRAREQMEKAPDAGSLQRYASVVRLLEEYTGAMSFQHPECSLGTGHPYRHQTPARPVAGNPSMNWFTLESDGESSVGLEQDGSNRANSES